jgi:hypothetical protein
MGEAPTLSQKTPISQALAEILLIVTDHPHLWAMATNPLHEIIASAHEETQVQKPAIPESFRRSRAYQEIRARLKPGG